MGRATEYFDYLNCPPDELTEHKEQYASFSPDDIDKSTRRKNLARKRKESKDVALPFEKD